MGFDGQGTEIKRRIERVLTLLRRRPNMQLAIANAGQYFPFAPPQMYGGTQQALVIVTPSGYARSARRFGLMISSGGFREVLDDPAASDPVPSRGSFFDPDKVYYDLVARARRAEAGPRAIRARGAALSFRLAAGAAVIARSRQRARSSGREEPAKTWVRGGFVQGFSSRFSIQRQGNSVCRPHASRRSRQLGR